MIKNDWIVLVYVLVLVIIIGVVLLGCSSISVPANRATVDIHKIPVYVYTITPSVIVLPPQWIYHPLVKPYIH